MVYLPGLENLGGEFRPREFESLSHRSLHSLRESASMAQIIVLRTLHGGSLSHRQRLFKLTHHH
ncbi:MAG: hypothetical protein UT39_C0009G0002 [Candidatus Woesebacteria bacterium GW2011_GWA1_39_21]|uniref:Uncharacterized protein n=1 Tax=Candidatus Woesebacteria bacterium GW2011_GWA1_39_21 TaxID=1618550 RepID=A0A0G0RC29_9BACT|nr:MAG: hypothetical protein UT39_C0009G0002 [Candidatus Woesebacteria bacterium GW2011_GWA1_39_21]